MNTRLGITFSANAHGRVNLIGEHTDYNGGWVLPTSIPQFTRVTLHLTSDSQVVLKSSLDPKAQTVRSVAYSLGEEKNTGTWIDYLQGATHLLAQDGFQLGGFEALIESTVPEGSGLSSSAALEISFLKAVREAFDLKLTDVQLAQLGQRIENEFVGARVGIMDQMACSLARAGEALFLDTLQLTHESLPLPLDQMDLLVINSGISHRNVGGGYNQRRQECEEACAQLKITQLRDLTPADLEKLAVLSPVHQKRARHVITENARVFSAVEAIRRKDPVMLGRLFHESHLSMRDDYEISLPEIDQLVNLCMRDPNVFGARLTGGGFGGSIVAITQVGKAAEVAALVVPEYQRMTGQMATILVQ